MFQGWPFSGRGSILWRNLKKDHLGNIPVKFGCNWHSSFWEEDFSKIFFWKTDKPQGGAILCPGIILLRNLKESHPRNIPEKFGCIRPTSSCEEDVQTCAFQNLISPRAGPFFARGSFFWEIWKRTTQGTILWNLDAIGPVVSEKIFEKIVDDARRTPESTPSQKI